MGPLSEELRLIIDEIKPQNEVVKFEIRIDENGEGSAEAELHGFLEAVILPGKIMSGMVSIQSADIPEFQMLNLTISPETNSILPIRMQCRDAEGRIINQLDKYPLFGRVEVNVTSAVPSSHFVVILIVSG